MNIFFVDDAESKRRPALEYVSRDSFSFSLNNTMDAYRRIKTNTNPFIKKYLIKCGSTA